MYLLTCITQTAIFTSFTEMSRLNSRVQIDSVIKVGIVFALKEMAQFKLK